MCSTSVAGLPYLWAFNEELTAGDTARAVGTSLLGLQVAAPLGWDGEH